MPNMATTFQTLQSQLTGLENSNYAVMLVDNQFNAFLLEMSHAVKDHDHQAIDRCSAQLHKLVQRREEMEKVRHAYFEQLCDVSCNVAITINKPVLDLVWVSDA